ncbi:AarF/ABC1/UbiB kinase family protein [Candidatus Woesearchaeota archaeon]|jgi:ubiquinone biosynthesis protein|nr:AarF/ABC1/UbiB kinase family protein [Candidatus Woesearchaeota archaeon]MBT4114193.1 AarF/ABC1/UbiB kinase family protein [Candidatus Woesearchaeota archaeon]MBT4248261.1 AarF/ABC1/UbiB kinase family protein [Candidatus Woesearchaeota archaeon]
MTSILEKIKDIKRFDEIVNVFFEEGFEYYINQFKLTSRIKFHKHIKNKLKSIKKDPEPVRMRKALEKLGPTFIKLGQILSVRPDLIPKEFADEFKKLQEQVPPTSFKEIKKIVEKELGKPISHVFEEFEEKPVASASVAQVHRAKLRSGEVVAVKVQKPKVKETMTQDIEIMLFAAKFLDKHSDKVASYNPVAIVKEFAEWSFRELDFRLEANNIKKFYDNLKDQKVVIPTVFDTYTTQELLVMSYEEGDHIDKYKFAGEKERKEFVQNFADIISKMIFEDGFFHGDPHPGNIFVTKQGLPLFLDFGMVGTLSVTLRNRISDIFLALLRQDTKKAIDLILAMTTKSEKSDIPAFRANAKNIIESWYGQPINKFSFVKAFYEAISTASNNHLTFPADLVLMVKALLDMEGIVLEVYPKSNVQELLQPWMEHKIIEKYNPARIAKEVVKEIKKHSDFYTHLPEHMGKLIEKIESGQLDVHIEESDLKDIEQHMDHAGNERSFAIIAGALFLSSSYFFSINRDIGPINTTQLGFAELIIAFTLLLVIIKQGLKKNYIKKDPI